MSVKVAPYHIKTTGSFKCLFSIIKKNNTSKDKSLTTLHTAKPKPFAWERQSVPTGQLCSYGRNAGPNLQQFFWPEKQQKHNFLFCSLIHFWVPGLMINSHIQNLWRPLFCLFGSKTADHQSLSEKMQKVDRKRDDSSRFSSLVKSRSCVSGKFVATEILSNVLITLFDAFGRMKSGGIQAVVAMEENTYRHRIENEMLHMRMFRWVTDSCQRPLEGWSS